MQLQIQVGKVKQAQKVLRRKPKGDISGRDFLKRSKKNIKMWTVFKLRMSIQL